MRVLLRTMFPWRRLFSSSSTNLSKGNEVISKKRGGVTLIGMKSEGNYLDLHIAECLSEALSKFEEDSSSSVAILHGESGSFCKGYNQDLIAEQPETIDAIERLGLLDRYLTKPVVGAINGYAVGAGFDLALCCDFRIVEETAVLACYARQFGLPLSERKAERLCAMLGVHKTLDLVLSGRVMKAKEGLECGLATRVVACGTAIGQSLNFAFALANMPQSTLASDRASLYALTHKYDDRTRQLLKQESGKLYQQALQEFKAGSHLTRTGDVRQKS